MILLVENDAALAETCAMMLESYGFDVAIAENGAEALAKIPQLHLDLMISDCAMPIMGGSELSRKVKADPVTCRTPILLM
ncbi:MAG: response regulator, partial [Pseudomonadota bacterium]|nr:response regulator [Pseudomonadota bacterium]